MDLSWMSEFYSDALRNDDALRIELATLHSEAHYLTFHDPAAALALVERGQTLAEQLEEPLWWLYYGYERASLLLYHLGRQREALDLAVRLTVEARKPVYESFDFVVTIYRMLIETYLYYDPLGYAEKIRESALFMERNFTLDRNTYANVEWQRSALAFAEGNLAEAHEAALRSLARAQDDDVASTGAHVLLCDIAYLQAKPDLVLEYGRNGEVFARRVYPAAIPEFLYWQAYAERACANEREAKRLSTAARLLAERVGGKPDFPFFDAWCAFHEAGGEFEAALSVRQSELTEAVSSGRAYETMRCHLAICRLLLKLNRPVHEAVERARTAARTMQNPSPYLMRLNQIQAGNATNDWEAATNG